MERIVHVWSLHQYFGGGGGVAEVRVTQKAGTWVADRELSPSMTLPPFPQRDLADERRRIAGTVSAFAQAWNGRDFEAMARLNVEDRKNYRGNLWTRHVRAIEDLGTDTRIDESIEAIEFEKPGSMSATVRLRLHGTWRPSPGAIVPLEPWKHEGAVTTVRLQLQKQTSSWEPGDWTILFLHPPWGDRALHY
jgi:hypothetical protein